VVIAPELLAASRRLLNRARLIAEAPAAQIGQVGHSHPSSGAPPGAFAHQVSTLDAIGHRMNAAIATGSDVALAAANEWALNEISLLTVGSPDREPETKEQFRYRIRTEYEGRPARYVADKEHISEELVRKIRTEEGLDARGRLTGPVQ
jgi:hypothetical protein